MSAVGDPHDLRRFLQAQDESCSYPEVLRELAAGRKEGHWIWFIFPQLRGLGTTMNAQRYGIGSLAEAKAYLAHPVLGPRLRDCARRLAGTAAQGPIQTMVGDIDALKIRSSMTLFIAAADGLPEARADFQSVLDRYYDGEPDPRTTDMLTGA